MKKILLAFFCLFLSAGGAFAGFCRPVDSCDANRGIPAYTDVLSKNGVIGYDNGSFERGSGNYLSGPKECYTCNRVLNDETCDPSERVTLTVDGYEKVFACRDTSGGTDTWELLSSTKIAPPAPVKTAEQTACEASRGDWAIAMPAGMRCQCSGSKGLARHATRDICIPAPAVANCDNGEWNISGWKENGTAHCDGPLDANFSCREDGRPVSVYTCNCWSAGKKASAAASLRNNGFKRCDGSGQQQNQQQNQQQQAVNNNLIVGDCINYNGAYTRISDENIRLAYNTLADVARVGTENCGPAAPVIQQVVQSVTPAAETVDWAAINRSIASAESGFDLSGFKTKEGEFNWLRLGLDVAGGTLVGAGAGILTNTLIKNSQLKSGYESVECAFGSSGVAGFGETFIVR